jgi:AcrR family transcriptional regulator
VSDIPDLPGLRERKKLRTQQQLRDAALTLFLERGFDNVTTDDIAAAVEVSKTTFYRYFESKEDVLLGSSAEHLAAMREALDARPADEPVMVAVQQALTSLAKDYEQSREAMLLKGRVLRDSLSLHAGHVQQKAATEAVVAEFVRSRLPESAERELYARVIAAEVLASLRATVDYWVEIDGRDRLSELLDHVLGTLTERHAGLIAPRPRVEPVPRQASSA